MPTTPVPDGPSGSDEVADLDLDAWDPWTPAQVRDLLAGLDVRWCVAAGWALDLFRGTATRDHGDIEIGVPESSFDAIRTRLAGYELYVAGDGVVRPLASVRDFGDWFQTWVRDPASGMWRLDVMREPHDGDTWICRRDRRIRRPYAELIEHDADGIPYLRPEYALLFKAKYVRPKDEADFAGVVPLLTTSARGQLAADLALVYGPDHPWITVLDGAPEAEPGGR